MGKTVILHKKNMLVFSLNVTWYFKLSNDIILFKEVIKFLALGKGLINNFGLRLSIL